MTQVKRQREKETLLAQTAELHRYFEKNEDSGRALKVKDLAQKIKEEHYIAAFFGHFSAGKSTMINSLIGKNILPSSPIPTSANLVTLLSGENYTKVHYLDGRPHLFYGEPNLEDIAPYTVNGQEIKSLEISYQQSHLPKGARIMDTPGIDSTDEAHRMATESALHLADLVFYVMDYNNVQSEVNFTFVKELVAAGKQVYLIVNQVDKHRDEELSFTEFTKSVAQSFASWGIEASHIFYTSLMKSDHPNNEFSELKQFIIEQMTDRSDFLFDSIRASLKTLARDHVNSITKANENVGSLTTISLEASEQLHKEYEALEEEQSRLTTHSERVVTLFEEEVQTLVNNAYLMPYETRERAEQFLEAAAADFKVGFLFTKNKTASVRAERLTNFYNYLKKDVATQLEWHLKALVTKTVESLQVDGRDVLDQANKLTVPFEKDLLEAAIKKGARLSGEYVLHYTSEITEQLKRRANRAIQPIKEQIILQVNKQVAEEKKALQWELEKLAPQLEALKGLEKSVARRRAMEIELADILNEQALTREAIQRGYVLAQIEVEDVVVIEKWPTKKATTSVQMEADRHASEKERFPMERELDDTYISQVVTYAEETAKQIKAVQGFKRMAEDLMARADRLQGRHFTVALFGAFSAGKSSFANALIGNDLLPVSPNPTTATINKIMPVTKEHPHGTARVKFKERQTLLEDVNDSLRAFGLHANTLADSVDVVTVLLNEGVEKNLKTEVHRAFLRAFLDGYRNYEDNLGSILHVGKETFQAFVAEEEKSCVVESIEVYVDCEFTRKGITIVDTPGADSINARHTNVSFEYIKNSDACFYVTYYNHAFSTADREFLIQLGRVKNTFALNKLFFIVNAIDLASSPEELLTVMHYVEEQLHTFGIEAPNMYPVSSLLGLKEKQSVTKEDISRIGQFEKDFQAYVKNEIIHAAVEEVFAETTRVSERLEYFISSAQTDERTKLALQKKYTTEKTRAKVLLLGEDVSILHKQMTQEIRELTYYIKQRVFLRFNDFLREAVHPAVILQDGRGGREQLARALETFLRAFGFDFSQEMRATTLRIESFIRKQLAAYENNLTKKLQKENDHLSFTKYEMATIESLEFEQAFIHVGAENFSEAFTYFKSTKTFFEGKGRQLMGEALEKKLHHLADEYIRVETERLETFYSVILTEQFTRLHASYTEQTNEFFDSLLVLHEEDFSIEKLMEMNNQINKQKRSLTNEHTR